MSDNDNKGAIPDNGAPTIETLPPYDACNALICDLDMVRGPLIDLFDEMTKEDSGTRSQRVDATTRLSERICEVTQNIAGLMQLRERFKPEPEGSGDQLMGGLSLHDLIGQAVEGRLRGMREQGGGITNPAAQGGEDVTDRQVEDR